MSHRPARPIRLGPVERAVLDIVVRDAPVSRRAVLSAVFPGAAAAIDGSRQFRREPSRRALAEATISRAIASLERKGLVVRDRHQSTGRTVLHAAGCERARPPWEQLAREEEDFAVRASHAARDWRLLSARAKERAVRLRAERCPDSTERERCVDVALARGMDHAHADGVYGVPVGSPATTPDGPLVALRLRSAGR